MSNATLDMVHVGLPFLKSPENGYVAATADDGEVCLRVAGEGFSRLQMPPNQARQVAQMLLNAAAEAEQR